MVVSQHLGMLAQALVRFDRVLLKTPNFEQKHNYL